MAQWDPAATSYTYPLSMHGGLYCNPDGSISKPFPDKPYCVNGAGTYVAVNQAGADLAICQVHPLFVPILITDCFTWQ